MSDTQPTEPIGESTQAPAATTPAAPAPAPTEPKRAISRWLTPLLAVVAALVIGLFGGILIGQHTGTAQQAGFNRPGGFGQGNGGFGGQNGQNGPQGGNGQNGQNGQGTRPGNGTGGGFAGGNFTAGTIQSVDGDTITITMQDGSTVKVTTTSATKVTKTDKASVSDLSKGETILVRGEKASDGSVKATTVTEGQVGGFGARPGAGSGAGN